MGRFAHALFCSAAIWVATAMPASAQEGAGSAPSDGASNAVDDGSIVVTARRREERLADVPTAASVIDAASLSDRGGATSTGELLADQPSVRFNNLNSSLTSEISIRASSTARATNGDPSIGLYRNGAYIGGGPVGGRNFSRRDDIDRTADRISTIERAPNSTFPGGRARATASKTTVFSCRAP